MITNIPKHNIPDELSRYLKGKQVDLLRKRPDRFVKPYQV